MYLLNLVFQILELLIEQLDKKYIYQCHKSQQTLFSSAPIIFVWKKISWTHYTMNIFAIAAVTSWRVLPQPGRRPAPEPGHRRRGVG